MKALYKLYQQKVTILDSTIDTLHEEIDNVRINAEQTFTSKTNEIVNKLRNDIKPQNVPYSSTHFPTTPTNNVPSRVHPSPYPSQPRPRTDVPSGHSPYQQPTDSAFKGVKMDVLRKLVKISGNDSDQLLDFYTKLRTAML